MTQKTRKLPDSLETHWGDHFLNHAWCPNVPKPLSVHHHKALDIPSHCYKKNQFMINIKVSKLLPCQCSSPLVFPDDKPSEAERNLP